MIFSEPVIVTMHTVTYVPTKKALEETLPPGSIIKADDSVKSGTALVSPKNITGIISCENPFKETQDEMED